MSASWKGKQKIVEMGVWLSGGFCSGLRGEEMLLIESKVTLESIKHLDEKDAFYRLVIKGRTKGSQVGGSGFMLPVVDVTEKTEISNGVWMRRLSTCR